MYATAVFLCIYFVEWFLFCFRLTLTNKVTRKEAGIYNILMDVQNKMLKVFNLPISQRSDIHDIQPTVCDV